MSETTNLKLFKHDNPDTNENQFDVQEALNNNWDKIDDFAGKVNDKVIEIEDNVEEQATNIENLQKNDAQQDKSIEALQKENTELKEECSRLRQDLNAFPSGTAEGEYITLKDSADSRLNKFVTGGNSKQDTRSGKNLCDNNFKNYTIDNYGYKKIIDSEENLIASLIDKDTSVDLTGIYFGFTHTGKDAIEGMVWVINNGVETANKTNQGIHQYISFYPANEETFNKIFARYDIQVEKGLEATEYEEYGAMPSTEYPSAIQNVEGNVNISVCNKNVANTNQIYANMQAYNSLRCSEVVEDGKECIRFYNSSFSPNREEGFNLIDYPYKENTSYTIRALFKFDKTTSNSVEQGVCFGIVYTDGSITYAYPWLSNKNEGWQENRIVTNGSKTIARIGFEYQYGDYWFIDKSSIFIGEGDTTDYVSHQEQVVTFPLATGQKLYKGDYLAKDGIHHVRKQIELDGTENWQYRNTNSKGISTFSLSIVEPDYKRYDGFQAICSHFKNLGIVSAVSAMYYNDEGFSFFYNADYLNSKGFYINTSQQSNLANFKNWLVQQKEAGTPVILEYELAEEEIEPYTEEQQKAYNEIVQTAKSYKNVTNIYSPDLVSPVFEVNYRKDIETMLEQVQAQTNAINELLSTTKTSATLLDNLQSDLESEVM